MRIASKLAVSVACVGLVFALGSPVLAVSANAQQGVNQTQNQTTQTTQTTRTQTQTEKKEQIQAKLTETKMKVCRNRERLINNIMARIADRGQKQMQLFTTISEKTQEFYKNKNLSLDNYETLVNEVQAKQQAVEKAMTSIRAQNANFSCDGSDPKGSANQFKESLKLEIAAMKEYKTAVRNLIVGVKSAAEKATVTPTPTEGVENAQ